MPPPILRPATEGIAAEELRARRREAFALGTASMRALTEAFRQQRTYAVVFATGFAALGVALTSDVLVLTTAALGIVAYLVSVYVLHRGALRLAALRGTRGDTRAQLRAGLAVVEETLAYNRLWVLVGTPIMTAAGFVIGVTSRTGGTVAEAFDEPRLLIVLAPTLAVLAAVMTWLVSKCGDRPYARHVADLRAALTGYTPARPPTPRNGSAPAGD